jgi:uncharacterized protein YbbC (DUF1343 family)
MLLPLLLSLSQSPQVTLGIDVLLGEKTDLLAGKRLGLVTHAAGVDGRLRASTDRLARDPRWKLVQLYAPEHGLRGDAPAGEKVGDTVDPQTGIPVQSLYGKQRRPTAESLAPLDLLLVDLQDVGSRTYTFVSTLGEVMQAAAEAHKPVLVLDRPNPLGGALCDGPVLEPAWKSFIGWSPIPLQHGMTIGELARFYRAELGIDCPLEVVPMRGWKRSMLWEDTGLSWVQTSPHMPHTLTAELYIATGMVGGILENVNEGVGTTLPFETIAAEFIDAPAFCAALEAEKLPGLRLRPIHYTPFYGKFEKKPLHGVQLLPTDPRALRPVRTAVALLCTLERLYSAQLVYGDEPRLGHHWGTLTVVRDVRAKKSAAEIERSWQAGLTEFAPRRASALLYQ